MYMRGESFHESAVHSRQDERQTGPQETVQVPRMHLEFVHSSSHEYFCL